MTGVSGGKLLRDWSSGSRVVARGAKKFWLLVEKDLAAAAHLGKGDEADVVRELAPLR